MWWFLTLYIGPYEVFSEIIFGCSEAPNPWVKIHEKSIKIHNFKKELVNVKMSVKMV